MGNMCNQHAGINEAIISLSFFFSGGLLSVVFTMRKRVEGV